MNTCAMSQPADELSITLLRRLTDTPQASQRELAREAGVSLGKLNYVLRALIDKGWIKAGNFGNSAEQARLYPRPP